MRATFKETMAKNFPNLIEATNLHIQEAQEISTSTDKQKFTKIHQRQTIEHQYKEESLKTAILKRNSIIEPGFLTAKMEAQRQWHNSFNLLVENSN